MGGVDCWRSALIVDFGVWGDLLVFGFAGFVVLLIACLVAWCGCCCFDDDIRLVLVECFLSAGFCGLVCVCGLGTVVSMPSGLDMVMNLWLAWFDLV